MVENVVRLDDHRRQEGELHGRMTPVGIDFDPGLSLEEWSADGQMLQNFHSANIWAVADWIIYGKDHYGEDYSQALGDYFAPETLARYERVGREFPRPRRREQLYYGHHDVVKAQPRAEQDELLDLAVKGDGRKTWSKRDLKAEIARREEARQPSLAVTPPATPAPQQPGAQAQPRRPVVIAHEPAGVPGGADPDPPLSADGAAELLAAEAGSGLVSPAIARAIGIVLEERARLLRLLDVLDRSPALDFLDVELAAALAAARSP